MMKRWKRLKRRLIIACLVLAGAALFHGVQHFRAGGAPEELFEAARESYAAAKDGLANGVEAVQGAKESIGSFARQRADAGGGGQGAITVYFTPAKTINPWGAGNRLVALIEKARAGVDCAFYELQLEGVVNALIAKHEAGIPVRIVSDTHYEERDGVQACIAAGIPVVFDKRSAFMHNKFCIVDGAYVWTGSTNITENGMYRNNNNALLIESAALAENYTSEFEEMFVKKKFGARSPKATPHPETMVGGVRVECYFAPEDKVRRQILAELREAVATIDFMAFSFTSVEIAEAMAERMQAGVRVRGIFETRSAGSKYSRDDFLEARGAEIRLDANKYTMHHKVIIIDGETVITGSYNFSKSAEEKNDENVLILHDAETAEAYAREFESLLAE